MHTKRFIFILICICGVSLYLNAQQQDNSVFDEMGMAQFTTEAYNPQSGIPTITNHRAEDVIWSRVVYRIIDMRYKQNYQLYYPTRCDDAEFRSLFKVIVDAIVEDDLVVYEKRTSQIKPNYDTPLSKSSMPGLLMKNDSASLANPDDHRFLSYDSLEDRLSFDCYSYPEFATNQLKYVIQEVIFFDRHYSRLYSKIMAIAPLQSDKITTKSDDPKKLTAQLLESLLFWIPFDSLRPYMQRQFTQTNSLKNDSKRVTFDEFFQKKLYTSYILGDGNMYNRIITDFATTPEEVKIEQERIATELLNFEQDLWEY